MLEVFYDTTRVQAYNGQVLVTGFQIFWKGDHSRSPLPHLISTFPSLAALIADKKQPHQGKCMGPPIPEFMYALEFEPVCV